MNLEDGGPAWADATIICPWTIYLCYGDTRILSDHYDSLVRYMDFLAAHRCKDFIRSHPDVDKWGGFGDWLALDGSGMTEGGTPRDLIGTAFYAYDAELMAKIARVLRKDSDAAAYETLHGKIVQAFQDRFISKAGLLTSGTQTAYVLALHFRLVPEEARASAVRELVRNIEKNGFHLATGFVGTPYLLGVLENNGHLDLAYKLLEQESFPSWLFPIKNGATTIWERWDGWTPEKGFQSKGMNSFNHYAYGAVGDWMYRSVAGLDLDPADPGYGTVVFRPRPGGSITHAEAQLSTPRGQAGIRWALKKGTLEVEVMVPEGAKGRFSAPEGFSGEGGELAAGVHRLVLTKR
jgi:alpha-L-rhamnosidase